MFDFNLWLTNADFTSETVDKLDRAKICDLDSLCLLSQYDVTALKLEIRDRGKFRRALRKLREQFPDDDEDLLNASTSSKPDDSFDNSYPEQVALQQRLQKELDEIVRKKQSLQISNQVHQVVCQQLHLRCNKKPILNN